MVFFCGRVDNDRHNYAISTLIGHLRDHEIVVRAVMVIRVLSPLEHLNRAVHRVHCFQKQFFP